MEIPGSAPAGARGGARDTFDKTNPPLERAKTLFERISEEGRWAVTGKPQSPAGWREKSQLYRAHSERTPRGGDRYETVWTQADVRVSACMSGDELVRRVDSGKLWPFAARVKFLPTTSTPVKWKLRATRLTLMRLFIAVQVACERPGVCATFAELALAVGLKSADHLEDLLRDLRAWGLVRADGTWVQHGRARSRRGSIYRITKLAALVFDLGDLVDVSALPDQEPDVTPKAKPARATSSQAATPAGAGASTAGVAAQNSQCAQGKNPVHPEYAPDEVLTSREIAISGATDRGGDGVVSASPTLDFSAVVTDESSLPSLPEAREGESCSVSRKPALWAGDAGDALDASVAGELEPGPRAELPAAGVDDDWTERVNLPPMFAGVKPVGDLVRTIRPGAGGEPAPRAENERDRLRREDAIRRRGWGRERAERRAEIAGLNRTKDRVELDVARRQHERELDDVPPPTDADAPRDAWAEVSRAAREQQIRDERRADLERYKRSLEEDELARQNRPLTPPRPRVDNDDPTDAIRRAWETRFGKLTPYAEQTLAAMKKGGAS